MGMFAMFMPSAQGDKLPAPDPVVLSGDDGTYVLDGMPAGKAKLRVSQPGYLDANGGPVTVLAGETLDGVDFVLAKESALTGRVVDSAGNPVEGATVGVDTTAEGIMAMAAQMMGGSWKTARTDAGGRYRVAGSTEGDHKVYVEAPGYLKQTSHATLPPEGALTMDFTLPPGHEIGGVVMRPDGTPLAGATVRISASSGDGSNPFAAMMGAAAVGRATTGEDGRFTAKGLPEGPYSVTARAPEFLDAEASDVQPGQTDIALRLGAAATVRGRVVAAADGTPVGGAIVYYKSKSGASSAGGNPMLQMMRGGDSQVVAQADGTYVITGIPGGSYDVWGRAPGFADSAKSKVVTEGGGTADAVDISLPPGAAVSGRVVRKGAGTPVEGALVWVPLDRSPGGFGNVIAADMMDVEPTAPPNSVSAKTAADGTFTLNGLTPGKIVIEARAKGLAALSFGGAEAPVAGVNCEMSEGGSVAGIAYTKAGVPMEGGTVMLQRGMMGQGMAGMATTDRNGRFRIDRVPPATYQVMLMDPEAQIPMPQMKNTAVRDGEVAEVTFGKKGAGRVVTGTVVRGAAPLTQGAVSLIGGSGGMQLATLDSAGSFRFEGVEPGSYTVTAQVQMMGGGNVSGRVTVAADADPAPVRLEMSVLSISGIVTDGETGKGVALAQVTLNARDAGGSSSLADLMARQRGQAFTGQDGRFTMEGVPQGVFDLRVVASGYAEAEIESVSAGANAVRVVLDKGLELAVTVFGPDGKPAVGAMVIPADASGREGTFFDMTASKQTGQDGVARMRLQPGRYTLRVRSSAYPEASVAIEASAGAVTVRLEDGGVLEVVAKTAAGQPAAGARVTVLDASGAEIKASLSMGNLFGSGDTTDAAGRAIRDGLRAGRVTVVVKSAAGAETRSTATVSAGEVAKVEVTLSE
jgi:protocatechuate 3,4-dioxygenase beta subunit